VRYDDGSVSCNASKTTQGCLGTVHVPASTIVDVLVSIHTGDGRFAFDDVHGTLEEDVGGELTLRATWNISKPIEDFCTKDANIALELSGNPNRSGAFSFFLGDLDQSCGGASASLGALTQ